MFFKKETFFKANRFYLLGSIILSFLIPLIKIPLEEKTQQQYVFQLKEIVLTNTGFVENQVTKTASLSSLNLVYLIGFFLFFTLFLIKLFKIFKVKQKAIPQVVETAKIYRIQNSKLAFSFFNYIFIGTENQNITTLIQHEKVHQNELHSLDLLFLELLKIVFWFNPMLYVFHKRIVEIHEFEADFYSVSKNKAKYYETLFSQIFEVNAISLTHNFFNQSLIKKRLVMLQKSKSKKAGMIKYLIIIPMTVLCFMLFSTTVIAQVNTNKTTTPTEKKSLEDLQEKQQNEVNKEEKLNAKKEQILNEIKAYNQNVSTEEKIKVLDRNSFEEKIVEYLEIKNINGLKKELDTTAPIPFSMLENPPLFENCVGTATRDAKECFSIEMNKHIKTYFSYPAEASKNNIKGRVAVMFVINKEGMVENIKYKSPENGELLAEEAVRIIKLLPKFKPAIYKGKPVSVSYAQPILFKIDTVKPIKKEE